MEGGIFSRFDLLRATCQNRAVPRFRLLVAALSCACLIAPAAAAFGVGIHLEWAEHHGEHHHSHDPVPLDAHERTPAADRHLDHAPHTHAIPELDSEPAVPRGRDTRAVSPVGSAGAVPVSVGDVATPGVQPWRLQAFRQPDASASKPDLVHLYCTLLI